MTVRTAFLVLWVAAVFSSSAPARAQLEVTVTPQGSAARERPLPNGAAVNLTIAVRNAGAKALGRIEITARFDGLSPATTEVWRARDGALVSSLERLAAGARNERTLRLQVTGAPLEAAKRSARVEARARGVPAATGEAQISVADCVANYRGKLEALRAELSRGVREAAAEMREPDASLPEDRLFPPARAHGGELATAERLAALAAVRRGADQQMATEWFRYMILRWASELNAYTGQTANPGLCANNYYQIAGYRQGLLTITKHIDAIHTAAAASLKAARAAAKAESGEDAATLVRLLAEEAKLKPNDEANGALAALASARAAFGARLPAPAVTRKFSLAETAAWLEDADRRGQKLSRAIEEVLSKIATAHKESCVCAF